MNAQFNLSTIERRLACGIERATNLTWLAAMVMMVQLTVSGCGGQQTGFVAPSGVDPDELYANSSYNTEDRNDEVEDEPNPRDFDDELDVVDEESVDESPAEAPPRERPQDVTQWIPEDFKTALMEEDLDLPDAILHVGRTSKGDSSVVAMLLGLLVIERPEGANESAEDVERDYRDREAEFSGPTEVPTEVVRSVIQALGLNESPVALAALRDMLYAKRQVPLDPRDLVGEVSRSLSQDIGSEKERILLAMVTKPEEIVAKLSPDPGNRDEEDDGPRFSFRRSSELDPDVVLEEVLQEAGPSTSTAFRYNLAKFLDDPDVIAETATRIEEFLSSDDRRNVPAQITLIQNTHTEPRTVDELQRTLTDGSRQALGQLLGIRAGTNEVGQFGRSRDIGDDDSSRRRRRSRPGGDAFDDEEPGGGPSVSPIDTESIVRYLWSPKVVDMLGSAALKENRPASAESGDDRGGIPLLLSTIPSPASRTALAELFGNRAAEGSEPWTSMGMFGDEVADPGVLVLAKAVYHDTSTSSTRTRRRSESDDGESSESDWETTLETYVQNLCEQFNNSARTSADSDDMPLPVKLHRGANIVTRYHAKWPDQLDSQWSAGQIAPLDLQYIRIEEEGRPRSVVNTYKRQASRGKEHELSGGGLWLDDYNQRDHRSLDIRITSESGDLGLSSSRSDRSSSRNAEDVVYTIEILSISIAPPDSKPVDKTAST